MPDFWTLIPDKNAPFFGDFRRLGTGVEMAPQNEASLAAIRGHNVGIPDWRLVGRNFPQDLPEIMDQSLGIKGA